MAEEDKMKYAIKFKNIKNELEELEIDPQYYSTYYNILDKEFVDSRWKDVIKTLLSRIERNVYPVCKFTNAKDLAFLDLLINRKISKYIQGKIEEFEREYMLLIKVSGNSVYLDLNLFNNALGREDFNEKYLKMFDVYNSVKETLDLMDGNIGDPSDAN